tara:strand:- start:285 stop:887 length:603 start_codon:yes stop_codon:yes gene_type:complete
LFDKINFELEATMLQFETEASGVYEALHKVKRTGWVNRGVKNPESVKEHTVALLELLREITHLLTEQEMDGLAEMLEVHDWPEAIDGDPVILELNPELREKLLAEKFESEKSAMECICAPLSNGNAYMDFWLRMELSDDAAAELGRQLDKYQAVEKALWYEQEHGIEMFQDFLGYALNFINHPVLLNRIEVLKQRCCNSV